MIPREKILVCIPAYDSRIDLSCITGLFQCMPMYHRPFFFAGNSNVAMARNNIAHLFVEKLTSYDWIMMIDSDTGFTIDDWNILWEGDEHIVTAEYARKKIGEKPVKFGLGFTRVHRDVFEKMKALLNDDGSERLGRFYNEGQMMVDYFPTGSIDSGRWIGEDQGFFMWAALTDSSVRIETRTRLKHIGRFEYCYPDQIEGFKMVDEEPTQ